MSMLKKLRKVGTKKLTFLYVPDDEAVRQFRVPQWAFHLAGAAVLAGLVLLASFGTVYIRAAAEGREMLKLKAQNVALTERLESMESHLAALENEMQSSRDIQQRLRLLADLDPIHPDVLEAGVGGPSGTGMRLDDLPENLRDDLETTGAHLSRMLRQARVQRDGYREILEVVQAKREEWERTPSVRPVRRGFLSSRFGRRMDPFTGQTAMHRGLDFAARRGSPVYATAAGKVVKAGRWGGYGLMVEIDHGNGLRTRYAHCSKLLVKVGQRIARGDTIARVGSTGKSTSSHVHYEVIRKGLHQDPLKYLLPSGVVVD